jgi:hypothetical protein
VALLLGVMGAACAGVIPPVLVPTGAIEPASDAVSAWEQATAPCRGLMTYSAELHLNGRVGAADQRVGGTLRSALSKSNEVYLALDEPIGPPGFVLSGSGDRATLVMPRDTRVLVAPAADIIEALTGLRIEPRELMAVLSGCVVSGGAAGSGGRSGDLRDVTIGSGRLWLQHLADGWRPTAGTRPGLLIQYRTFAAAWPSEIGIASSSDAAVPLQFRVRAGQVIVDSPRITSATFVPRPPADATPLTLDELRRMGPLGEKKT